MLATEKYLKEKHLINAKGMDAILTMSIVSEEEGNKFISEHYDEFCDLESLFLLPKFSMTEDAIRKYANKFSSNEWLWIICSKSIVPYDVVKERWDRFTDEQKNLLKIKTGQKVPTLY